MSRAFYEGIGAEGLQGRTRPEFDALLIADVVAWVGAWPCVVLDVGCGYGRVAVPLAGAGHRVTGLDLSPSLLEHVRRRTTERGVGVGLVEASMTAMPLRAGSFDVAVCVWSAFNELLRDDEQEEALREVARVVRPGGRALFDGPAYRDPTETELRSGLRRGVAGREDWTLVEGRVNPHFLHDEETWRARAEHAGLPEPVATTRLFGGRIRQVVTFQF